MVHSRRETREVGGGTYVVLLLIDLVRNCVFGGLGTGGEARVGVALCDF